MRGCLRVVSCCLNDLESSLLNPRPLGVPNDPDDHHIHERLLFLEELKCLPSSPGVLRLLLGRAAEHGRPAWGG